MSEDPYRPPPEQPTNDEFEERRKKAKLLGGFAIWGLVIAIGVVLGIVAVAIGFIWGFFQIVQSMAY